MKVQWTKRAKARLREIESYITKDNPKAARDVVEKLLRRSWRLADLRDIGHEVEGYEGTD
jgi:plasmid stabilization system protein ParE